MPTSINYATLPFAHFPDGRIMDECIFQLLYLVLFIVLIIAVVALRRANQGRAALNELRSLKDELQGLKARLRTLEGHGSPAPLGPPAPLTDKQTMATATPATPPQPTPVAPPTPAPLPIPAPTPLPPQPPPLPISRPIAPAPPPLPPPTLPKPDAPKVAVPPPPKPRLKAEDFLASRFFLRIGVAVLVLGVLFALGLVFQKLGPVGKVLMAYGAGGALLAGGLALERLDPYRTIARALIAGAWAMLFVVTFAAGHLDAAKVFMRHESAVAALFVAASACVAFSLRYRHEMTTTGAFLLIHLSLGVAGHYLAAPLSLSAAVVVSVALSIMAITLKWHRLLGLGALATWINLLLHLTGATTEGSGRLVGVALVGLVFLAALVLADPEETHRPNAAFTVLGLGSTFMGLLGLGFLVAPPESRYAWSGGVGLVLLVACAVWRQRQRRGLYLFAGTLALLALGLVTPLRLGLRHHLAPVMRLLGLQVVLAAGVYLEEGYWRKLAYLGWVLTGVDLLIRVSHGSAPSHLTLLLAGAVAALGNAAMARGPWRDAMTADSPRVPACLTAAGTLFLGLAVWRHAPSQFVPLWFALLAALWIGMGALRGLGDLAIEGLVLAGATVVAMLHAYSGSHGQPLAPWLALLSTAVLMGVYSLVCMRSRLETTLDQFTSGALSCLYVVALGLVAYNHLPLPWRAPAMALVGWGLLAVGGVANRRELRWEAMLLAPVVGIGALVLMPDMPLWDRLCHLGVTALLFQVQELHARRWPHPLPKGALSMFSLAAVALVVVAVYAALPAPWIALSFTLGALIWTAWAWRAPSALHAAEGLALTTFALVALFTHTKGISGTWHGLPARLLSGAGTLVGLYGVQDLWRRMSQDTRWPAQSSLFAQRDRTALSRYLLPILAVILALLVKVECLGHNLNLLVALFWGLLALVHLERGRALQDWSWLLLGHIGMLAALSHFIGVNLLQEGTLGGISLRLATGIPLMGMVVYGYLATPHAEAALGRLDRLARWRAWYLYGGLLVLALLLRYELPRAWVVTGWAVEGTLALVWWLGGTHHGTRAGALLGLAALVQGIAFNLVQRDTFRDLRVNLIAIPVAVVCFLAAYILLHRRRTTDTFEGFAAGRNRLMWLSCSLALLLGFIWVELAGTLLTVLLSAYGLGVVGLGFAFRERFARLAGLGVLSFCVLKLFFYDLRGLSGLPRVLSFIVLGLVLISVAFVYTRFRERQEDPS